MRKYLGALLLTAGLLVAPGSAPAVADDCTIKSIEDTFHRKINDRRRNNNRSALTKVRPLVRVARHHTGKMVSHNDLFHSGYDNGPVHSVGAHLSNWTVIGENVGRAGNRATDKETAEVLMQMFMDSPTHRDNILGSRFNYMGAGVEKSNGLMYVTLLFSDTNPNTSLHSC